MSWFVGNEYSQTLDGYLAPCVQIRSHMFWHWPLTGHYFGIDSPDLLEPVEGYHCYMIPTPQKPLTPRVLIDSFAYLKIIHAAKYNTLCVPPLHCP